MTYFRKWHEGIIPEGAILAESFPPFDLWVYVNDDGELTTRHKLVLRPRLKARKANFTLIGYHDGIGRNADALALKTHYQDVYEALEQWLAHHVPTPKHVHSLTGRVPEGWPKCAEFFGWTLYEKPAKNQLWRNFKLVAGEGSLVSRANFWLGWNGERLARDQYSGRLEGEYPDLHAAIFNWLQTNYPKGSGATVLPLRAVDDGIDAAAKKPGFWNHEGEWMGDDGK